MKTPLLLALALTGSALAGEAPVAPAAGRPVLRIATDATFPPFHYKDDAGAATGFELALARLVAERAGFEPLVVVRPYDELLSGLATRKHDMVAATTGVTPERERQYLFTTPYFETCQAALVRAGAGEPSTLADLRGHRVGAAGAGTSARALQGMPNVERVPLGKGQEGVPTLEGKGVDALILDEYSAVRAARASSGRLRVLPEPVAHERYAFVLARGRDEVAGKLDRALAELEREGRVSELRSRFAVERDATWPVLISARPRGRDLGIPFANATGPLNAITDVPGVAVGHATIIEGEGKLVPGKGPIRTGVTAVLPRPKGNWDFVMAATFNQNGNGDMTGVNWIEESGFLEGPILLTGTHSVGTVRDAALQWQIAQGRQFVFTYPVVAETFDFLNDANGEHVKPAHAWAALDAARPGPVTEGAVGGGTGMGCNGFKGGIGTSSRVVSVLGHDYTLGVLVQCNYGGDFQVLGVPVGREITDLRTCGTLPQTRPWLSELPKCDDAGRSASVRDTADEAAHLGRGSIVVIVATDAPLVTHQLKRVARRVGMGLGKLGSWAGNSSGDLFLAFSTANPGASTTAALAKLEMVPNDEINPFFRATIDATEEAVVNAMLAAPPVTTGADGLRAYGLPPDRLVAAMKKYGRMK
ncbi:MAG TPA: P1 family peptidase [Vicinamibacteria bacterium]|nr:P1 family peptidase [Vicinamibacteria bacterium]